MPESDRPHWPRRLAMAGIVLSALAAYGNSFPNAFVYPHLADIVANPTIRHLWPIGPVLRPPAEGGLTVGGRPMVNLSLALNYAMGGTQVWGYHAVNLLIHIAAGLTLFGVIRRTLAGRIESPDLFAFAVSLLWTLHPLQTESVTYVIERAESLMGLFYLLTIYGFIRYADRVGGGAGPLDPPLRGGRRPPGGGNSAGDVARRRPEVGGHLRSGGPSGAALPSARRHLINPWAILSILSCLFGMATKEVMVSAPLIVLIYDRTFVSRGFRKALRDHRWVYASMACTWALVGCLALGAGSRGGTAGFGIGVPWRFYAETQFEAVAHYLGLAAWPHPLVFDYGAVWVKAPWEVLPSAIIVAGLLAATAVALWRRPAIGLLGASFFSILAPTSLVPVVVQTMAEHRMYLALAPVLTSAVWAIRGGLVQIGAPRFQLPIFLLLGLALGLATAARNRDYRSNLTLWTVTASQRPGNPRAHYYRGVALDEEGRPEDGIREMQIALELDPDYPEAHNRLGIDLMKLGKAPDAIVHYEAAIRLKPDYAEAHYNLGTAFAQSGALTEAVAELQEALRLKPDFPDAQTNLGGTLTRMDRLPEAIAHYEEAIRLRPENALDRFNLGSALAQANRMPEAIIRFEEALRLNPAYAEAHSNLGVALARSDRLLEAIAQFKLALRLKPGYYQARYNLARALEAAGKAAEARAEFEAAERLGPPASAILSP